jgi:hypothetical protein
MNAVALAIVLLTGQSPPSAQDDFYMDEKPQQETRIADFRAGAGGAAILDVNGELGAAAEAGLELKPWGPVGLRISIGSNMKIGWGTFYLAPEAVFRLNDIHSTFSPYLTVGGNVTLVNISDQALGIDRIPIWRAKEGAAGSNDSPPRADPQDAGAPLGSAIRSSFGPQATLGLRWQAFNRLGLDLGARWTMLRFRGETYQNFGAVLTVCAPAQ